MKVREARAADCPLLLAWRNDDVTRAHAFGSESISQVEHEVWFSRTMSSPLRQIWIGEVDGVAVGQVRFDRDADATALIDIAVAPEARGTGVGRRLLKEAMAAEQRRSAVAVFRAEVVPRNDASRALFAGAGFSVVRSGPDRIVYESSSDTRVQTTDG